MKDKLIQRTTARQKAVAVAAPAASGAQLTTAPIRPADVSGVEPEFCRVSDLRLLFGLRRGTVYNLLHEGEIESVCLRRRGRRSGVRLISVASVREFLKRAAAQPGFVSKGKDEGGAA